MTRQTLNVERESNVQAHKEPSGALTNGRSYCVTDRIGQVKVVDDRPHDECGVFGVFAPGEVVSKLTYYGLFALQHRGQESSGIAVSNGKRIMVFKDMGLVSQVYDESSLASLTGHIAIGHDRYSTTGSSVWSNAQPTFRSAPWGDIALAHNGNLTNTDELASLLQQRTGEQFHKDVMDSTSDTILLTSLICSYSGDDVVEIALDVLPKLQGAFSLVFMTKDTLYAARDRHGVRPLVLGRLEKGWVVASETAALDIVGATFVREVEPGELIMISENGLASKTFAKAQRQGCIFEYVYLARPDSVISGRQVEPARAAIGERLAEECPVEADMVVPVPDSGIPAAVGYARKSGIPFGIGLVKNAYVGRTFIQPSQTIRQRGIQLKLNPIREEIEGKRLVVVDDSIVRGNTQRALIKMLRAAGAAEVHVRISSPPVLWPCFFGIDFATRAELIAPGLSVEEIATAIGADTLGFVSIDGMTEAVGLPANDLCRACFDGKYHIQVPQSAADLLLSQKEINV